MLDFWGTAGLTHAETYLSKILQRVKILASLRVSLRDTRAASSTRAFCSGHEQGKRLLRSMRTVPSSGRCLPRHLPPAALHHFSTAVAASSGFSGASGRSSAGDPPLRLCAWHACSSTPASWGVSFFVFLRNACSTLAHYVVPNAHLTSSSDHHVPASLLFVGPSADRLQIQKTLGGCATHLDLSMSLNGPARSERSTYIPGWHNFGIPG
jgi:hypothetical protein